MSTSHYKIFCRLSVGNILVILLVFACTASSSESYAKIKAPKVQSQKRDTTKVYNAKEVIIDGYSSLGGVERMPDVKNGIIYAGKKTEVIQLDKILADVSTNNARQVFAKVPGISLEKLQECAEDAKTNCPVSKALNADITVEASLAH